MTTASTNQQQPRYSDQRPANNKTIDDFGELHVKLDQQPLDLKMRFLRTVGFLALAASAATASPMSPEEDTSSQATQVLKTPATTKRESIGVPFTGALKHPKTKSSIGVPWTGTLKHPKTKTDAPTDEGFIGATKTPAPVAARQDF